MLYNSVRIALLAVCLIIALAIDGAPPRASHQAVVPPANLAMFADPGQIVDEYVRELAQLQSHAVASQPSAASPHRPGSVEQQRAAPTDATTTTASPSSTDSGNSDAIADDASDASKPASLESELKHAESGDSLSSLPSSSYHPIRKGAEMSIGTKKADTASAGDSDANVAKSGAEEGSVDRSDAKDNRTPTKPKQFAGAARLAFGHNAEPIAPTSTTTTAATTTQKAMHRPHHHHVHEHDVDEHTGEDDEDDDDEAGNRDEEDADEDDEAGDDEDDDDDDDDATEADNVRQPTDDGESTAKIGHKDKRNRSKVWKMRQTPEMLLMRHSGGEVSSLDMAQYVFWTGDEQGVAQAVQEFIDKGLMSRDNAIKLLREISMGIEYLQRSYTNRAASGDESSIRKLENNIKQRRIELASSEAPARTTRLASSTSTTTTSTTTPAPRTTTTSAHPPAAGDLESLLTAKVMEKIDDANKIDNQLGHMGISDKVRLADSLYTAYTLEETIYQLAKVMFYQSLTSGSQQGTQALQRLTAFLELESVYGHVSPMLQKRILDVLLTALSDCLKEHPDLIPAAREGLGAALDELIKRQSAVATTTKSTVSPANV